MRRRPAGDEAASGGRPCATPDRLDEARAAALLPERDARGHKGTFGRLVVVAGSLDYAGAALMAGSAALRAGCGLVTLCLPGSLQPLLAGRVPELITRGLPEDEPGQMRGEEAAEAVLEQPHEALVLGPGLRPGPGTDALVETILATGGCPAVVDAGALDALAARPGWPASVRRACVLTPHPGELRRLGREPGSTDDERAQVAFEAAASGARSSCSREQGRSSPLRMAGCCGPPSRCPRSARPAAATCWPASSARCWRRACRPSRPPRWVSSCMAVPGRT